MESRRRVFGKKMTWNSIPEELFCADVFLLLLTVIEDLTFKGEKSSSFTSFTLVCGCKTFLLWLCPTSFRSSNCFVTKNETCRKLHSCIKVNIAANRRREKLLFRLCCNILVKTNKVMHRVGNADVLYGQWTLLKQKR